MKFKILLIIFLSTFLSTICAQEAKAKSIQINWKGVEKWYADSLSTKFITFEGARYPTDNRLPYFRQKFPCDSALFYQVELINPQFIPVTAEESELISSNLIPTEISFESKPVIDNGNNSIELEALPFVSQGGKIVKLLSFDIRFKKVSRIQKVSSGAAHTYANQSVLASGKFVKIRISDSGVYKLTYDDLNSMGLNPSNVKVFGYGGALLEQSFSSPNIDDLPELPIYMNKGSDGVFNSGDYVLFYGQGVTKWSYDSSKAIFTHTINSYSKYGYYFVTSDAGIGKRIEEQAIILPDSPTIIPVEEFTDYQVHEKEVQSLIESGKEFYGETFNDIISYYFSFNFPNPILTNSTVARLDVAASATVFTSFSLSLNGGTFKTLSVSPKILGDNYTQAIAANNFSNSPVTPFIYTPQGDQFVFNLIYNKSGSSASIGYLNYLEVNVRRQLIMTGSVMQFQNIDNLGTDNYNQYFISNANSNVQIWDITDKQNIFKIPTQVINGKLSFIASGNTVANYLAIDPTVVSAFATPTIDGVVTNQNLHGISQADMVIITHPDFLSQAQTLAEAHRKKDNLTVEVATTNEVYNEFSSGTPDATAYRWIMKMLYDRAGSSSANKPKYLLLFGRGSYDNRKLFSNSGDAYILTYQADNSLVTTSSYVTDDYFGLLKDNQGSQVASDSLKLGIGRLPVTTAQQATNVVNKIVGYMNNTGKGNWKNQICYLADDGDAALHMTQADSIARIISRNFPSYQVDKIYLDAYHQEVSASGESYPLAKSHFMNLLSSGLFFLNYTGHAGTTGWANEGILTLADVKALSNQHLPLIFGATCDFLQFDTQITSGGEQVVLNPLAGGIGIISAARPVYASQNMTLDKYFCENIFKKRNGEQMRIGDALAIAKNSVGSEINKLSYIYMGDPALQLNFPTKYNVVTSSVVGNANQANDTLRAFSIATINGYIADDAGNKVTNFNGTIHSVVFDKIQRTTTQNNHQDGALTYSDRPNTLFSGDAGVKDGEFSFSFMLPKDIKYNFGGGRINYYAADDINNNEAQGYFENFIVGGTDKNNIVDTIGPAVQLYLNSEYFISGDKVNEKPLFIANISDEHGINTVGSGIGHDITLTIDNDPAQSYILNDYFQANKNSYTDGVLNYKLPEMVNGKHTVNFRVWDLLNNSSSNDINFEVVKGLTPVIFSVYNYPNPVKSSTTIIVNHDRPETILSTVVDIFDVSGRKIWSFSQSSASNITWDLKASNGQKVDTGIYLYRVSIKTANSDMYSKTNKMFIVKQ